MNEVPQTPPPPPSAPWGTPPQAPAPKRGWSAKWVVGTIVAVLVVLGIIGAATGEDDKKASPPPTTAAVVETSPDTFVTATTVTEPEADTSSIVEWASTAHGEMVESGAVLTKISELATAGDMAGTIAECRNGSDVFSAWPALIADAPTSKLREAMASAYSHYSSAFTSCANGDFESAITDIQLGTAAIQDATVALEEITP